MAYDIRFTKEFGDDLDSVLTYIAEKLCNKSAAMALLDKLTDTLRLISDTPEMFELSGDPLLRAKSYRRFIIGNYIIFYRVSEADKTVYVLRMIYGKRGYFKFL